MSDKQKVCSLSPDRRREVVFICLYVSSRFCVQLTDGVGWCVLQNSEPSPLRYSCSLLPHMLVLILV